MKRAWGLLALLGVAACAGAAGSKQALKTPVPGVVCDKYVCADSNGLSAPLTEKYLGKNAGKKLASLGDFDHTQFTFANGIFCDVKEKLCRKDRYYGMDGKRSGAIDQHTTNLLFHPQPAKK
ncbi:YcgJ family protein [[Enterobacter] lignolyticus]|uniref:Fels-1 Prophage Protein-like protein n=1 Tax=[Enterobacter] lignolyticus TaxID=1334193 RepID=A0A806X533_9ENTR|nr:YcgJ family protein [[Enterobacter] lignolyticus]ALR75862.1 hypothetical protein AO703_05965 [[Enterobacter] lignolyticus]